MGRSRERDERRRRSRSRSRSRGRGRDRYRSRSRDRDGDRERERGRDSDRYGGGRRDAAERDEPRRRRTPEPGEVGPHRRRDEDERGGRDWRRRSRSRSRSRGRGRGRSPPNEYGAASRRTDGADAYSNGGLPGPPPPPKEDAAPVDVAFDAQLSAEELRMMQSMGIPFTFDSTQGKHVEDDSANASGYKVKSKRTARQYMNRKGGFNRPLPLERTNERVVRD